MGTSCDIFNLTFSGFKMRHSFWITFQRFQLRAAIILFECGGSNKMHIEPKFYLDGLTVTEVLLSTLFST